MAEEPRTDVRAAHSVAILSVEFRKPKPNCNRPSAKVMRISQPSGSEVLQMRGVAWA